MRKILILITLFNSLLTLAQTKDDSLKFGDAAFADGDYYSASLYFSGILKKDSSDISLAFKFAESCRLFNDWGKCRQNLLSNQHANEESVEKAGIPAHL